MATTPFDIPIELRTIIFESLSLRDISRLRQACSEWKNNLQDLSFLKVLDFSYSPDITEQAFKELVERRINTNQNNIIKVIIAHTSNLTLDSLTSLFQALPRIKDIRIRHSFNDECLPILLQQKNLECLIYMRPINKYRENTTIIETFPDIECTKLTRCKINLVRYYGLGGFDTKLRLKLLELNPALKNDIEFLSHVNINGYEPISEDADNLVKISLASNKLRVYVEYWAIVRPDSFFALYLLEKTLQLLSEMTADQLQTNKMVHHLCYLMATAVSDQPGNDDSKFIIIIKDNLQMIKPLADLYQSNENEDFNAEKNAAQHLERLKKRPFHKASLFEFLAHYLRMLRYLRREIDKKDKYEEELNRLVEKLSTVLKKMPGEIVLLRAPLLLRKGKLKEAFDEFLSGVEPNFVLSSMSESKSTSYQAFLGAYHVAKDYLKSPELLEQLSPENCKVISEHYEKLQPCFDQGLCTRATGNRVFYSQYWYGCYTCGYMGMGNGLCYSCTKTCHAGHEVDYVEIAECYCDDTNCKFEDEPEEEHLDHNDNQDGPEELPDNDNANENEPQEEQPQVNAEADAN